MTIVSPFLALKGPNLRENKFDLGTNLTEIVKDACSMETYIITAPFEFSVEQTEGFLIRGARKRKATYHQLINSNSKTEQKKNTRKHITKSIVLKFNCPKNSGDGQFVLINGKETDKTACSNIYEADENFGSLYDEQMPPGDGTLPGRVPVLKRFHMTDLV